MKHIIAILGIGLALACSGQANDSDEVIDANGVAEGEPGFAPETVPGFELITMVIGPGEGLDVAVELPESRTSVVDDENDLGQLGAPLSASPGYGLMANSNRCTTGVWNGGICLVPATKTRKYVSACAPANLCPNTASNDLGFGIFNAESVMESNGFTISPGTAQDKQWNIRAGNVGGGAQALVSIQFATLPGGPSSTQGTYKRIVACDALVDYNKIAALVANGFYGTFGSAAARDTARSHVNRNATARAAGYCTGLGNDPNPGAPSSTVMYSFPPTSTPFTTYSGTERSFLNVYVP